MKKNLIAALKKLLKAFGGDDTDVKNNAVEIVDKIANQVESNPSGGNSSNENNNIDVIGFSPYSNEVEIIYIKTIFDNRETILSVYYAGTKSILISKPTIIWNDIDADPYSVVMTCGYPISILDITLEECLEKAGNQEEIKIVDFENSTSVINNNIMALIFSGDHIETPLVVFPEGTVFKTIINENYSPK